MATFEQTFRVFVSSTFSDLKAERNALQEQVFPKLRDLCQKHGCRFQAIDLRWGVSEEAALDQQTIKHLPGGVAPVSEDIPPAQLHRFAGPALRLVSASATHTN